MLVQIRSVTEARIVGRVLVNIQHTDYEVCVQSSSQTQRRRRQTTDTRSRMPDSAPIPSPWILDVP